jgi:hypothetical protein
MSFEKNIKPNEVSGVNIENIPKDPVEILKKELADDYKNFKDPEFYYPGGKSELEKSILEKESKLKSLEGERSSEKIKDSVMDFMEKKSQEKQDEIAYNNSSEKIKDSVMDFMEKSFKVREGAGDRNELPVASEPLSDNTELENMMPVENFGRQPEEQLTEQPTEQPESESKDRRGRIFEFIRKHPKIKWAVAAMAITAIGLGIFKTAEGAKDKDKKIDKKEIVKPGIEPDNPDIPVVKIDSDPKVGIKDKLEKGGVDVSGINGDVLDTILEEVGGVANVKVLKSGDGIGVITKTAENNTTNIMTGNTLVSLIDNETGAIYRDQEASSILVHPGDIVLENSEGECFVIADKAGLNYEKSIAQEADSADVSKKNIETQRGAGSEAQASEGEGLPSIETKLDPKAEINNPESLISKKGTPSLEELEAGAVDLSAQARETGANNNQEVVASADSDETPIENVKEKKGLWKRIFGGRDKK